MDLKLDESGDLIFANGETIVTQSDFDVVSQRLKIRLQTFQGEYNYNTEYGVPYFQRILGKRIRKQELDNIFQQQILLEDGVTEIVSFTSTFTNNIYELRFTVRDDKRLLSPVISISVPV